MSLQNTRFYQKFVGRIQREARKEGLQEGRQEGLEQGHKAALLRTISRQLGRSVALPGAEALDHMERLSIESLEELTEALLAFKSPEDLTAWLAQHPA